MGMLAPWLLGGFAFLVVPWIIHRKRKPPRNPTPFSSLMFVPQGAPTTRARKQVENPWLMALRMLLLLLLALAFARPYQEVLATYSAEGPESVWHVLLVDVSASMSADENRAAREEAIALAFRAMGAHDAVAVVAFDSHAQVVLPFAPPENPTRNGVAGARKALASLPESAGATDFRAALSLAESLLQRVEDSEESPVRREIHLVSDLQRTGLPADGRQDVLSENMVLHLYPVHHAVMSNVAVEEMALLRRPEAKLLVRARVQHYGESPVQLTCRVVVDGEEVERQPLSLSGRGSRTLSFLVDADTTMPHRVAVEAVESDAFEADNARYAYYTPEPMREIGVLWAMPGAAPQEVSRFLNAAMAESQPLPWQLSGLQSEKLADGADHDTLPDVLVVVGSALDTAVVAVLEAQLQAGGRLLLIPDRAGYPESLAERILKPLGVQVAEPRFSEAEAGRYASFSWVDFEHPVFQSFREPQYSDFSMVRFQNFFTLLQEEGAPSAVIARLEGDHIGAEFPAVITATRGEGEVLLWAFPLDPDWTNLMRTRRFIPLLHESIALLLPPLPTPRTWHTGEVPRPSSDVTQAPLTLQYPSADGWKDSESMARLTRPGFVAWADQAGVVQTMESVNSDRRESDLAVFDEAAFRLRVAREESAPSEKKRTVALSPRQDVVHWEYGYPLLAILLAGYVLESGIALWLARPQRGES